MAKPNHALVVAIRDVLKQHGVASARVEVDLRPPHDAPNELLVVVYDTEAPRDPAELPAVRAAPRPRTPQGPATPATPATRVSPASPDAPGPDPLEGTARPASASASASATAPFAPSAPATATAGAAGLSRQSSGRRSGGGQRATSAVFTPEPPARVTPRGSTSFCRSISGEGGDGNVSEGSGSRRKSFTSLPSIERAGSRDGSKQRLLEMLQEQRDMEQQRAESRIRHDSLVKEAEEFLDQCRREKAKNNNIQTPLQEPQSRSPRSSSLCPQSSQGTTSSCGIQVVKVTMPSDDRAKEEFIAQLSMSSKGSEHVSNKEKFSALFREQDKLIHDVEAGEEDYQKALQQAIAYNEQRAQQIARERAAQEEV